MCRSRYLHGSTGTDWIQWFDRELPRVMPLNDTGVALPRDPSTRFSGCTDETFDLLGTNDFGQGDHISETIARTKAKLPAATARQVATPERASLLLAHQPRSADRAAESGTQQLTPTRDTIDQYDCMMLVSGTRHRWRGIGAHSWRTSLACPLEHLPW